MKNWLRVRNIPFWDTMLKVQLYEIIKAYKPKYKTFLLNEIMTANGHETTTLSPWSQSYRINLGRRETVGWRGKKKKNIYNLGQMTLNIFVSRDSKKLEKTSGSVFVNMQAN
jgi:hypothetical protein